MEVIRHSFLSSASGKVLNGASTYRKNAGKKLKADRRRLHTLLVKD
jgi:hypothetical protein